MQNRGCRSSLPPRAGLALPTAAHNSLGGRLQAAALSLVRPPVCLAAGLAAVEHGAAAAAAAQATGGATALGSANAGRALGGLLLRGGCWLRLGVSGYRALCSGALIRRLAAPATMEAWHALAVSTAAAPGRS